MNRKIDKFRLASFLDFANHRQDATPADIEQLCEQVKKYGFNSAFVNPCYLSLAKELLKGKGKVGTVISFPLGQDTQDSKVVSVIEAVEKGADELDICMNVGLYKGGEKKQVVSEMVTLVQAARNLKAGVIIKFIIETGFLTDDEIKEASIMVLSSGADFVKTCSGMGPRGAKLSDVKLIRQAVGQRIRVKVAGGITDLTRSLDFIIGGVDRIGTSHALEIMEELGKGKTNDSLR